MPTTFAGRFWPKVNKDGPIPEARPELGPYWIWTAWTNNKGYGMTCVKGRKTLAHRAAWEAERGPIPGKLELDHVCRNTHCIRPSHLELVTHQENMRRGIGFAGVNSRKVICKRGHELSGTNLIVRSASGYRNCRACANLYQVSVRARKRIK